MAKSLTDRDKRLQEVADQLRLCDDEGPELAGVCVPLLARARKLAAFEGSRYANVRTALDRWREHKKNAAFWDEVVGTVRLEGQNDPHAPHVITFQRVVSALWPDLADYVEDTITVGGKARPHHTGKCGLHLWCHWREAKDRLAQLIESIAGSKPGGAAAHQAERDTQPQVQCFVTLQQAAAMVSRSKKTLERRKKNMPLPKVSGGGGKPDEWAWSELRPWLEKEFERPLPERFPADRFRPT
jgi:hypothetical protein